MNRGVNGQGTNVAKAFNSAPNTGAIKAPGSGKVAGAAKMPANTPAKPASVR